MPRFRIVNGVVLLLAGCLAPHCVAQILAQPGTNKDVRYKLSFAEIPHRDGDLGARILQKRLAEVSFEDAPLDQAFSWFEAAIAGNLVVRYQALEDAGVERDKPISLQVQNLTAARVLWLILREASGPDLRLSFEIYDDELVVVSTADDIEDDMIIRVYDVKPILRANEAWRAAADLRGVRHAITLRNQLEAASSKSGPDKRDASQLRESDSRGLLELEKAMERFPPDDRLDSLLITIVSPDSWAENGGRGTVQTFNGLLTVRQSRAAHREVESFLNALMTVGTGNSDAEGGIGATRQTAGDRSRSIDRNLPSDWRQVVDEVSIDDPTIENCLVWLTTLLVKSNLVVRWQTLEEAGISRDRRVDQRILTGRLDQRLARILGGAGGDVKLAYELLGSDLLVISTAEDLNRNVFTRIYDVRALLEADAAWWAVRDKRIAQRIAELRALLHRDESGPGGAASETTPAQWDERHSFYAGLTPERRLLNLILYAVDPDSWAENGGRGTAECFSGMLTISQSQSVHRQVEALLNALAEMSAAR